MRKTKVRIVGEPELAKQIAQVILKHFEVFSMQHFDKATLRYGKNIAPLHSYYFDIQKPREART
jgi:hypothetical protein